MFQHSCISSSQTKSLAKLEKTSLFSKYIWTNFIRTHVPGTLPMVQITSPLIEGKCNYATVSRVRPMSKGLQEILGWWIFPHTFFTIWLFTEKNQKLKFMLVLPAVHTSPAITIIYLLLSWNNACSINTVTFIDNLLPHLCHLFTCTPIWVSWMPCQMVCLAKGFPTCIFTK